MADALSFKTDMRFAYGEANEIVPGVERLVANNKGPLTFHGTNTYLIGLESLAVIDPGPHDDAHLKAILKTAGTRPITHILITHRHRDHVDGVAALKQATNANTYAFAQPRPADGLVATTPTGRDFVDLGLAPDVVVTDGDRITGSGWELSAIHTPGHAPDHLCFALEDEKILFSGDHVMAWNTSVIAPPEGNMADYLASLENLLERDDAMYLPGHGGRIDAPQRTVRAYLLHRKWREQAILEAICNGTSDIKSLVSEIYSSVPESVSGAAALSVLAHVEHLHAHGLVICEPKPSLDAQIHPA